MPHNASVQDVADAYMMAWELGVKALAIYRDGSKEAQPLSVSDDGKKDSEAGLSKKEKRKLAGPRRERLPDTRDSKTHKFNISGHEGYITVGLYPDGRVGELFITMAKEGSTIGGLMDCFGTAISMSLQYGVPLRVYVEKFSHTKFDPQGHTKNPDIPIAKSLVDYIFRWLGQTFLPEMQPVKQDAPANDPDWNGKERRRSKTAGEPKRGTESEPTAKESESVSVKSISVIDSSVAQPEIISISTMDGNFETHDYRGDAPLCDTCGCLTTRNGNCFLCYNCGKSLGCS
jgi:ribonucleoside-diphosphate reductase alpha chain